MWSIASHFDGNNHIGFPTYVPDSSWFFLIPCLWMDIWLSTLGLIFWTLSVLNLWIMVAFRELSPSRFTKMLCYKSLAKTLTACIRLPNLQPSIWALSLSLLLSLMIYSQVNKAQKPVSGSSLPTSHPNQNSLLFEDRNNVCLLKSSDIWFLRDHREWLPDVIQKLLQ